jgi:hypothetical protein
MLSGAKHLQYLLARKQAQILRFAQDDNPRDFFRKLLDLCSAQIESVELSNHLPEHPSIRMRAKH